VKRFVVIDSLLNNGLFGLFHITTARMWSVAEV